VWCHRPWLFVFLGDRNLRPVIFILTVAVLMSGGSLWAQAPVTPGQPPPQVVPPTQETPPPGQGVPPATTPDQATPAAPAQITPGVPGTPAAPAAPLTRTFTSAAGLLLNTVRPERVKDFETVMWYLQEALKKSTDPTVRAQAEGWKIFRAVEPGPNAVVLYVFALAPAVPGADYGLGRILADAYPEQIQEIWKLYQGSVTSGGTLLNLNLVEPMPPMPLVPLTPAAPGAPAPRTPPPPATTVPAPTIP
jgi:hypothetical protein